MGQTCNWATTNDLMLKYHDEEWGVPLHNEQKLFEFLVLEGFQAGLSWQTILNKRENFRRAFDNFNVELVASYNETKVSELMQDSGIIRNKLKIEATINNAKCFIQIQHQFGSFEKYIWNFTDFKPIVNAFQSIKELPAKTELSDRISADLKKKGFKFVGSTIVYAHMQATGMVNDHLVTCDRHKEIQNG